MPDLKASGTLRKGWTTGTCAAAAAAGAYEALLTGRAPPAATVPLPRGGSVSLPLAEVVHGTGEATAVVIKDAGDDPDVTHGASVRVTVRPAPVGSGVRFHAGDGVGTVTLPGLPLAVGEPAINPGPRAMIGRALAAIAERCNGSPDVDVTVAVAGGAALAERTLNARLGIVGGLSILGTTGVVQPYSCAAWIHSIHRGIDVARAAGLGHLGAATGRTSEAALRRLYALPPAALIDMGDFVGGTLKYLRRHPVPRLTLAGGFAKIAKLAQGHLYLHSAKSRVDVGRLATMLETLGAPAAAIGEARTAGSAAPVLAMAEALALPLADAVAEAARARAAAVLGAGTAVDVLVVDRGGRPVGRAGAPP
jgi:cobalt-precorrin-5B (C1)-methyltransferase